MKGNKMNKLWIAAALGAALALAGCDQAPKKTEVVQSEKIASVPAAPEIGRYVIVHSPAGYRDTVMLDTVTGKTWSREEYREQNFVPKATRNIP
jgi:hypothetical protein